MRHHHPPHPPPCSALDAAFRPKPEITHQHRQPERRAPAVVSLFFSLVALAPLAAFLLVALQLGANLKVRLGGASWDQGGASWDQLPAGCPWWLAAARAQPPGTWLLCDALHTGQLQRAGV